MARDTVAGPFDVYQREKELWQQAADIETNGNMAEFVRRTINREAERLLREFGCRKRNNQHTPATDE